MQETLWCAGDSACWTHNVTIDSLPGVEVTIWGMTDDSLQRSEFNISNNATLDIFLMGGNAGDDSKFYCHGEGTKCNIYAFKRNSTFSSSITHYGITLNCYDGAVCNTYFNDFTTLPIDTLSPTLLPTVVPSIVPSSMPTLNPKNIPTDTPSMIMNSNPTDTYTSTTKTPTTTPTESDTNKNNSDDDVFGNVSGVVWIVLMTVCIVIIVWCFTYSYRTKTQRDMLQLKLNDLKDKVIANDTTRAHVEIGQITATTISSVGGSHGNINREAKIELEKEPPLNIKRSNDNLGPYRSVGV